MKSYRIKESLYSNLERAYTVQYKTWYGLWRKVTTEHALGIVHHTYPSLKEADLFIEKLRKPNRIEVCVNYIYSK